MVTHRTLSQNIIAAAITLSVIGTSFAETAQAKPYIPLLKLPLLKQPFPKIPVFLPKPGFPYIPQPKPIYGNGYGYGAAALAGGLALGGIAATLAARSDQDCTVLRRIVEDQDGNQYVRHVRVCE